MFRKPAPPRGASAYGAFTTVRIAICAAWAGARSGWKGPSSGRTFACGPRKPGPLILPAIRPSCSPRPRARGSAPPADEAGGRIPIAACSIRWPYPALDIAAGGACGGGRTARPGEPAMGEPAPPACKPSPRASPPPRCATGGGERRGPLLLPAALLFEFSVLVGLKPPSAEALPVPKLRLTAVASRSRLPARSACSGEGKAVVVGAALPSAAACAASRRTLR
eukprot:scaffold27230_cov79-Isochrysis_galbana.AAC.1